MASLDIFNDNAFGVTELTLAMEQASIPAQPLTSLFQHDGLRGETFFLEQQADGALDIVPVSAVGSPPKYLGRSRRKVMNFSTFHIKVADVIRPEEVAGVRAFGSETELKQIQDLVNEQTIKLRGSIEVTHDWHRMGAIKGQILDANGDILVDLYNEFNVTKSTFNLDLTNSATDVKRKVTEMQRLAQAKLLARGKVVTGWRALCSPGFLDKLSLHPDGRARFADASPEMNLRTSLTGFDLFGVRWDEYSVGNRTEAWIADGKAYLIPTVKDLLIGRFTPASYMSTVNKGKGRPMYAITEVLPKEAGVEVEVQSRPLFICTMPEVIVELSA